MPRDRLAARDGVGVGLDARWIWSALPKPPGVQEVDSDAIGAAATKVSPTMEIELVAVGRMRLSFLGVSFPLPARAELRARADRYGHVLVWPNGKTYRVLAPGALRSVLAERRADVTPLVPGKRRKLPRGSYMGLATERDEIVTPTGKLVIEQADVALAGRGGPLLCRALAELDTVQPSTPVCAKRGRVPLKAKYRWATGGEIEFEVTALARRQDIPIGLLYTPPAGALFKPAELPPEASGVFLTRNDLAGFRTSETKPEQPPGVEAPGEGLYAVNETDALQYLLLDGVPVAWVRPHQKQYVIGPKAGRYTVAWRDFLTTESTPPREVQLPARLVVGGDADGGK